MTRVVEYTLTDYDLSDGEDEERQKRNRSTQNHLDHNFPKIQKCPTSAAADDDRIHSIVYKRLSKARDLIQRKPLGSPLQPLTVNNTVFTHWPKLIQNNNPPTQEPLATTCMTLNIDKKLLEPNNNPVPVCMTDFYARQSEWQLIYDRYPSAGEEQFMYMVSWEPSMRNRQNTTQVGQFMSSAVSQESNFKRIENSLICIEKPSQDVTSYEESRIRIHTPFTPRMAQEQESNLFGEISFESRFQSGNLGKVYKPVNTNTNTLEYDLILTPDINTPYTTQWFYFLVTFRSNTIQQNDTPIVFNIVNFTKDKSLFGKGMKVLVYDCLDQSSQNHGNKGWHRAGYDIKYRKNNMSNPSGSRKFYTLSFTYDFKNTGSHHQVYFAYHYPYTYTELNHYLDSVEAIHHKQGTFRRQILTKTPSNNRVEMLTISKKPFNKPVVFISARVHSGQTVSSLMLKGVIDCLLSDSPVGHRLRQNFIFKIVPMLNPDGVIHGNYRCNIAGHDLNRRWLQSDRYYDPEISAYKDYIKSMSKRNKITLVLDLHGHSTKKNIFAYGCTEGDDQYTAREFPYLFSKLLPSFSFKDCCFEIAEEKEGTQRVALWRSLRLNHIYTIESSFCSAENQNHHFSRKDIEESGYKLCEAIHSYFVEQGALRQECVRQLRSDPNLLKKTIKEDSDDEGNQILAVMPIRKSRLKSQSPEKHNITTSTEMNFSKNISRSIPKSQHIEKKPSISQATYLNSKQIRNHIVNPQHDLHALILSAKEEDMNKTRLIIPKVLNLSAVVCANESSHSRSQGIEGKNNYRQYLEAAKQIQPHFRKKTTGLVGMQKASEFRKKTKNKARVMRLINLPFIKL